MYQFIDKVIPNEKRWYLILAVSILVITFLVTVVYKNENLAQKKHKDRQFPKYKGTRHN